MSKIETTSSADAGRRRGHGLMKVGIAAFIVSSQLACSAGPAAGGEPIDPGSSLGAAVFAERLGLLARLASRPPEIDPANWPSGAGLLFEGATAAEDVAAALAALEPLIGEAVATADPETAQSGPPSARFLDGTDTALYELRFAARQVSPDLKLSDLTVRVWVAGTRQRALEVYWLLSGNTLQVTGDVVTVGPRSGLHRTLTGAGSPGEAAFEYKHGTVYNRPLFEGEVGAGGDCVGSIFGNVVVEVGRDTIFRRDADGRWSVLGLSGEDREVLVAILGAVIAGLEGLPQ